MQRKLRDSFGQNHILHNTAILHIMKNIETRYITDVPKSRRPYSARIVENIAIMRDGVAENSETSIRRRAQEHICNAARGGYLADIIFHT